MPLWSFYVIEIIVAAVSVRENSLRHGKRGKRYEFEI